MSILLAADPAFAPGSTDDAARLRAAGLEAVQTLAVLLRHAHTYETNNDVFLAPIERLRRVLAGVLVVEPDLRIERQGADIFANGTRLRPQLRTLRSFRGLEQELGRLSLGGFRFDRVPTAAAVARLLEVIVASTPGSGAPAVNRLLESAGLAGVEALAPHGEPEVAAGDRRIRAMRAYDDALELIRGYMTRQESPAQLSARRAKRIVHKLVDLSYEEGMGFSLAGLAAIRTHDQYTYNHMVNVCVLAIAFGQRLGLRRTQIAQLGLCGLYHDMGKLHVPLDILNRRGGLRDEEWALMGNHTIYAARTLFPLIADGINVVPRVMTALQHHLRYDGTGYPRLHLLRRQTLFARITAIVDSFDAMTTLRVYQGARLPHQALAEIQAGSGTRYDPILVRAFVNCMGIYPIGSAVKLRSGEVAVVCESNPDPDRAQQPRVRLVEGDDPAGNAVIDLAAPGTEARQILSAVDPQRLGIDCARYAV